MLPLIVLLAMAAALCACKQDGGNSPPQTPDNIPASVTLAPVSDEPQASNANATPDEPLTSQQQFIPGTLDPETNHYIIASATTDQFGDNEQYTICLYSSEKPYKILGFEVYGDVYLGVYGSEMQDEEILTDYDCGDILKPNMHVGDFTGDGLVEVLVEIPMSSADGLAPTLGFIYSFDGKLRRIFDNDDMNPFAYIITFEDNYKISVTNRLLGCSYRGDLSTWFASLDTPYYVGKDPAPIYNDAGKAATDIPHDDEAVMWSYCAVNDLRVDGGCGNAYFLCSTESLYNLDVFVNIYIGDVVSYLKWDSTYEKFIVVKQYYVPVGSMYFDSDHYWNIP